MAVLRIAQMGHPILRQVSRALTLEEVRTSAFQNFCDDMLETMEDYDGVGLAAPQVHHNVRVVIATLDDETGPEFFVNPVITVIGDTLTKTWEGCLSVEGLRGRVERPDQVRVDAWDRDGTQKTYELEGFPAVVIQHECDHLDGVLYVDRVEPKTLAFLKEHRRFGPANEPSLEDDGLEADDSDEVDEADELGDFDDEIYGELTSEEFRS